MDSGDEFARIEGFRKVVVRPNLKPDDTVNVVTARCQHQDRHMRLGAELPQDFEAVEARQHHIEDHQRVLTR